MTVSRAAAATARSQQVVQRSHRPAQRRSGEAVEATRSTPAVKARLQVVRAQDAADTTLNGYASVTESAYEMWDMFGPYTEIVSQGAFGVTLAGQPDVQLNYQHGRIGTPVARSTIPEGPGSLVLGEDSTGLVVRAVPLPGLTTTNEMLALIDAKILDEMSFAFTITRGKWSPDYSEYRIDEVNIDRGDVSVVNYGANPATSVGRGQPEALKARAALIQTSLQQGRALTGDDATFVAQILGMASAIDLIADEMQEDMAEALGVENPDDEADDTAVSQNSQGARLARLRVAARSLEIRRS